MWTSVKREGFPEKWEAFVDKSYHVLVPCHTVEQIPFSVIEHRLGCAKQMKWSGQTEIWADLQSSSSEKYCNILHHCQNIFSRSKLKKKKTTKSHKQGTRIYWTETELGLSWQVKQSKGKHLLYSAGLVMIWPIHAFFLKWFCMQLEF